MAIFDMPSREVCSVIRSKSNTPLQALSLLNSVTHVEAAKKFAERMLLIEGDLKDQIRWGFRSVTSRMPDDTEIELLLKGYQRRLDYYKTNSDQSNALLGVGESKVSSLLNPDELASMTTVANVCLLYTSPSPRD